MSGYAEWDIYIVNYYSALRRKEVVTCYNMSEDIEDIILSGICQS